MRFAALVLSLLTGFASAYSPSQPSRRDLLQSMLSAGAAVAVVANPAVASALEACPTGSKNCILTKWTPPAGTSKDSIVASLKKALDAYPQGGQESVDLGGWTIVEDFSKGYGRVEFKSGIGNFAKFFNGGKPFVDDLKIEIADSGVVEVKSSSRVGESDFGVNQKRLKFLVSKLREDGWNAPEPAY